VPSSLSRFDEWLNRALEECARNAGEDVHTYVARAVASQMVVDQRQNETIGMRELLDHLSEAGVYETDSMPDVVAALSDPDRLRALQSTGLLDSGPEEGYDRITRAAAEALDVPYAALALIDVDRQFFKSTHGMGDMSDPANRHTSLDQSISQYAVVEGAPLVLEDARRDPVFQKHPLVRTGAVIAYLAIPLADHDGHAIGTLCVFDGKPRQWGTGHIQVLSDLALLAMERIFGPAPASGG
jgi:hypothetical protein